MVLAVPILSVVSDIARGFKVLLRKNRLTLCVIITIPANQIVVSQTFRLLIGVLMDGGGGESKYVESVYLYRELHRFNPRFSAFQLKHVCLERLKYFCIEENNRV